MPKLREETELARVSQTVQVMGLLMLNPTMKMEDACQQVGITVDTYRRWLHSGRDTIENLRGYLTMVQREMLFQVSTARAEVIRLLIKDAIDPLTSPKDRVTLERRLDEIAVELQRTHHATPGIEEDANRFLKEGPVIEKKRSRLATLGVERTDDGVTVTVYEENDVIDVTPTEPETDSD